MNKNIPIVSIAALLLAAGWKRSGSDQALLERIRDLVSTCTALDWHLLPDAVAGVLD